MSIEEIQQYVAQRIAAHPQFIAAGLAIDNTQAQDEARANNQSVPADARGIILDDGTYPKLPGLEDALRTKGLAIIVWRIGCFGLVDVAKTGLSNSLLHIPVVIQENVKVNRETDGGTGIVDMKAYEYVSQSVSGYPKNTPPGTPILPHGDPFENFGKVNGISIIVANFEKQHRINPI